MKITVRKLKRLIKEAAASFSAPLPSAWKNHYKVVLKEKGMFVEDLNYVLRDVFRDPRVKIGTQYSYSRRDQGAGVSEPYVLVDTWIPIEQAINNWKSSENSDAILSIEPA